MAGFGHNVAIPDPLFRFVGIYNANFGTSLTVAVNVPIADFQYPADNRRQILVGAVGEVHLIDTNNCNINGTLPLRPVIASSYARQCVLLSATMSLTADFTINLTRNTTTSEDTDILVYEAYNALDLYKCGGVSAETGGGTTVDLSMRRPRGASIAALALAYTDTVTFTWTGGVTEVQDTDAGDNRISGAVGAPLTSADRNFEAVTPTISASGALLAVAMPILRRDNMLSVAWFPNSAQPTAVTTAVGNTMTLSSAFYLNFAGLGKFRFYTTIAWENDITITGVTLGGNAMTLLGSVINTGASPDLGLATYYYDVDSAVLGSGDVVVTFSGVPTRTSFWTYRAYIATDNFNQINQATASNTANAAAVSANIAVGNNGHVLAFHIRADNTQTVVWSGTGIIERGDFNGTNYRISGADVCFVDANASYGVTATGSASGQCALLVHSFSNP